jgi:hypothetical protein
LVQLFARRVAPPPDEVKRWVYNLYGLTDEETEIVKEAVGD